MKIAILHMTMGLTSRGSEAVIDLLATALTKHHNVMVLQSGKIIKKPYAVKRVAPIDAAPTPAPGNVVEKLFFRLHLDAESSQVARFTRASLPLLATFTPDLIIAVNGALQLKVLAALSSDAKIVVFGHAGIGYHDRDTLRAKPDLFVALTPAAMVWAKRLASAKTKVVYIPNPIDLPRATKGTLSKLTLDKPIILTVGAFSKYKNIDSVIAAIRHTTHSLLLVGDGEQAEQITQDLSTLANSFIWKKRVVPSDMGGLYRAADVFCFVPDPQEAFGMVYLEAMVAGLPIVASDDPIRRHLIGEKGIFVDPHNSTHIARGLTQALSLGKVNYRKELKPYALATVVDQIEKEFHALIN